MYNTEGQKDSRFIDAKVVLGSQQLLIKVFIFIFKYILPWQALKEKKFKMKDLQSMKATQLNELLLTIGLDRSDISK